MKEAEVCLQLQPEGSEEGTMGRASLRAKERRRNFWTSYKEEKGSLTQKLGLIRGKVHPCSDIEERQERQRGTRQLKHLFLTDTGRINRKWCSNTTLLDSTLVQKYLQSCSKIPSHQTALFSKQGSACISMLFHYTVSSCPSRAWQVFQHYNTNPCLCCLGIPFPTTLSLWYHLGYFSAAYYRV